MMDSDALKVLIALGDLGRFEIFRKLLETPGLTTGELDSGKAASTVSHHLKIMESAGVIRSERLGKHKSYVVVPEAMSAFSHWSAQIAEPATFAALTNALDRSAAD